MHIVYFHKKPNSYPGHADGGILVFDDQDILTYYLFKSDYRDIEKILVTDVISNLLRFSVISNKHACTMYRHEVNTYKNFLAIPSLTITVEYTLESNPELYI